MARLATVAASDPGGRVRCRSAYHTNDSGVAESFRFLSAEGTYTLRDWAAKWRTPFCQGFQSGQEREAMDLRLEKPAPVPAFCSIHLSPRGGHHSRFVPNVCRVCRLS